MSTKIYLWFFLTAPATIDLRRRPLLCTVRYVKVLLCTANQCVCTHCSISEMVHVVCTSDVSSVWNTHSKSEINRPLWRRRWSVGIAPYILKLVTAFNLVLRFTPQPLYPPLPAEQEAVRTPYRRTGNFHPVPGLKPLLPSSQAAILNAQQVSNLRANICHSNPGDSWLWNCTASSSLRQMEVEAIGRRNLIFP